MSNYGIELSEEEQEAVEEALDVDELEGEDASKES